MCSLTVFSQLDNMSGNSEAVVGCIHSSGFTQVLFSTKHTLMKVEEMKVWTC